VIVLVGWYALRGHLPAGQQQPELNPPSAGAGELRTATQGIASLGEEASGTQRRVVGHVQRLLTDDRDGSPHQRFILELGSGQTLLIAHNIELAPRLNGLAAGDQVEVYGEYEWNDKGGLIHWTHKDPAGHHVAGYIEWRGRRYQ
jgi:hypothetical protein